MVASALDNMTRADLARAVQRADARIRVVFDARGREVHLPIAA